MNSNALDQLAISLCAQRDVALACAQQFNTSRVVSQFYMGQAAGLNKAIDELNCLYNKLVPQVPAPTN